MSIIQNSIVITIIIITFQTANPKVGEPRHQKPEGSGWKTAQEGKILSCNQRSNEKGVQGLLGNVLWTENSKDGLVFQVPPYITWSISNFLLNSKDSRILHISWAFDLTNLHSGSITELYIQLIAYFGQKIMFLDIFLASGHRFYRLDKNGMFKNTLHLTMGTVNHPLIS